MKNRFTRMAEEALSGAEKIACKLGHTYIGSEHLLLGLIMCRECIAASLLRERGASEEKVRAAVIELSGEGEPCKVSPADMTPSTKKIIRASADGISGGPREYIGTEHLLAALLDETGCVAIRILDNLGVSIDELQKETRAYISVSSPHDEEEESAISDTGNRARSSSRAGRVSGAPNISRYGRDLTSLASAGRIDPVIGRDTETERVIQILSRRSKNNPCLIGEPGVGKTAVIEGLAQRIADGSVPESLRTKRIVTLDIPSMIAGAKYRGEFEERMKNVMAEAANDHEIILFIDEIHTIIGAGAAEGAVDAANIIKPALARGELHMIGATTIDEYRRHIEKDPALERRFQSVTVGEPSEEQALAILRGLRSKYEAHHGIRISDGALSAAISLSVRYIHDRFLPDKAIDLIDEAASKVRIRAACKPSDISELEERLERLSREKSEAIRAQDFEKAAEIRNLQKESETALVEKRSRRALTLEREFITVTEEDIADTVTQWTSIPQGKLLEGENERLLRLEESLASQVYGQDHAIRAIASAIRRGRAGLSNPEKPIGSFIFLGPSGVGKTQLSKALSAELFGDEKALIRLDMSEYMEKQSVSKLIGSPPGYVGYEEGGYLTELIRRRPFSVVLFDEIEKAHPDVTNILLQILDDGILNDSRGRRVHFKNSVIIMTSNLGAAKSQEKRITGFLSGDADAEKKRQEAQNEMKAALKSAFSPEFLNRIDEIIVFDPLPRKELERIAEKTLKLIARRAEGLGISVTFEPSAVSLVAQVGEAEKLGARPLERAAIKLVEEPLSELLLKRQINEGDSVRAFADGERVEFEIV